MSKSLFFFFHGEQNEFVFFLIIGTIKATTSIKMTLICFQISYIREPQFESPPSPRLPVHTPLQTEVRATPLPDVQEEASSLQYPLLMVDMLIYNSSKECREV